MIQKWRNLDLFDDNFKFPIKLKKIIMAFTRDIIQVEKVVAKVFEVKQQALINISW